MREDFASYADEIASGLKDEGGIFSMTSIVSTWEPPLPFETVEHIPDFPVECLPGPVAAMVEALAESTQTPEEMGGLLSLGVLATAFQKRYTVEATPDWVEPLCLYTVAVAPPGERKSAVIAALTKPIYEYEADQRSADAVTVAQNRTERELLESALQAAKTATAKGKADKRMEALDLTAQLAEFEDLYPLRLLADDTTAEKLIDLMDQQGGCITVVSAEGGIFDAMRGRYDQGANFDVYLKGHAGDPLIVDRIGRKGNHIQEPRLTMMLTIQPEVLTGMMENTTFRGRGLCGRFLYAMCRSRVGHRSSTPPAIPETTKAHYREYVRRILSGDGKGIIRLSQEADAVRVLYQDHIEKLMDGDMETMRDWAGKLTGAVVRIAALLHAGTSITDPTATPISSETMTAAVSIGEFLRAHAQLAYQAMGSDPNIDGARYILKRVKGMEAITRSELTRLCRGRFPKTDEMDAALAVLQERGYMRPEANPVGYNNRVQVSYKLNPLM